MSSGSREKIIKSWSGVSEVSLIKEVATKGEHIETCIEYWAKKRKIPLADYRLFFHDVVQTYVHRLLSERLICKAENVLKNVERNIKYFYFQFARECEDDGLREMVFDYLQRKYPDTFQEELPELQFTWELQHALQNCARLKERFKSHLKRINMETIRDLDAATLKQLMVELYFENRNPALLRRLDKLLVWDFLLSHEDTSQIVRWCACNSAGAETIATDISDTTLEAKFRQWSIESDMYKDALESIRSPSEALRNCFAKAGFFFPDECRDLEAILRRVCTMESFEENRQRLAALPFGRFLLERDYFTLVVGDLVSAEELDELTAVLPSQRCLIEFLAAVKKNDLHSGKGFEKISHRAKVFLESRPQEAGGQHSLLAIHEFLCSEPTLRSLNDFLQSNEAQCVPYLKSLGARLTRSHPPARLPTPHELLLSFKKFNMRLLPNYHHDGMELVHFSDRKLCEKYARKYPLNFVHYLRQQRSCFAVYRLLADHLKNYGQVTSTQLFMAAETVTEIALQNASNDDLLVHCVAFNEMLGFDTQNLRNYVRLTRQVAAAAAAAGGDCLLPDYSHLIGRVEGDLLERLRRHPQRFPLQDYEALMRMVACNQFRKWPELIMRHYAQADDWWRLLVLLQYFNPPLDQVRSLLPSFKTPTMGEHLLRALAHEPVTAGSERAMKRHHSTKKQKSPMSTASMETVTSSMGSYHDASAHCRSVQKRQVEMLANATGDVDLFGIILLSTSTNPEESIASMSRFLEVMQDNRLHSTSLNLLKNSVKFRLPVLCVLAVTVAPVHIGWSWLVWLSLTTGQWNRVAAMGGSSDPSELVWTLIENCVRSRNIANLHRSICIFYENKPLAHLVHFLYATSEANSFNDDIINELRFYFLAWSNDEVELPLCAAIDRDQLMYRSIQLLLLHIAESFASAFEQHKFLQCVCQSGVSDISGLLDFCLLNEVFTVLQSSACNRFALNFERLLANGPKEYKDVLGRLQESREYDLAIRLASILRLPISDIVYTKWLAEAEAGTFDDIAFERYESEIREYSLPPDLLVNFYLYAAGRLEDHCAPKYLLLKRALNVIKRNRLFPNESFDWDQIEYEMILCYLQISDVDELAALDIYHSEYFEEIMLKERCVLYKSFLELKELAGIEDLTTTLKSELTDAMKRRLEKLLNRLLDEGDIVEALRLQELFQHRPIDLRFVVFCMALAEGVTTIFSMSTEERHLLRDVQKSSFGKFNKRTLDTLYSSGSHPGAGLASKQNMDISDSCSMLEFEEIPSKEKRETLDTIQGIASRLQYGVNIGSRIVMAYRAAMYLDKYYVDVLRTKDPVVLLRSVAEDGCLHKLLVVSDIITSTQMTAHEVAELLAYEITTAIVRPRFYIFSADQRAKSTFKSADLWGYNIDRDLHLFLELTPNTTLLGHCLLEYCDALKEYRKYQDDKAYRHTSVFAKLNEMITRYGLPTGAATSATSSVVLHAATLSSPAQVLSHKKQNIICVELLIKAHQCFVHECSMEGIANVLNRAKNLNNVLTSAKSWSLIVRMLIGIGRYREMFYCFDSLIDNEQFESLLGQFEQEKTVGFRQAIISYLREYGPENSGELLKLAALHFLMYKELAVMWEHEAQTVVNAILSEYLVSQAQLVEQESMTTFAVGSVTAKTFIPKLSVSPEVVKLLHQAMETYTHATENYLLDNTLLLAQKSASQAELIAMQIDLAHRVTDKSTPPHLCVCVLNVQTREEFRELINAELTVPQTIILGRAYGYDVNWAEVLLSQFVILRRRAYLHEYLMHYPLTDNIVESVAKSFQMYAQVHKREINSQMEGHLAELVEYVKSITLKYRLASLLGMKPTVLKLINEQTMYYLQDTNYGRNESHSTPDI